jgi:hypothetical protein
MIRSGPLPSRTLKRYQLLFVGSPETTAVKVTGVATGAGDAIEAETPTVIPLAAVCPISANPIAANIRQLRISRIILLLYKLEST